MEKLVPKTLQKRFKKFVYQGLEEECGLPTVRYKYALVRYAAKMMITIDDT